MAFGTAGGSLEHAQALGRPDRTPAVQLIEGPNIGLERCGQAVQLIVETVVEGDGTGITGLGPGRQSDG